jgi:hypothetical protein
MTPLSIAQTDEGDASTEATEADLPPAPVDAGTFAEPSIVSPSWKLDLELGTPRTISAEDYNGSTRWFWYAPYKVTNLTEQERLFAPEVTITDDYGNIIQAGAGIAPSVFEAVQKKLDNPLLESPEAVVGQLLQGPDFARESVIIWPVAAQDVDRFTIFFAGVDGETQTLVSPRTGESIMRQVTDPITGQKQVDDDGNPVMEPVQVRRTRAFDYASPGTHDRPQAQPVKLLRSYEVMR